MPTEQVSDSAVKLTAFFMKGIGLWSADNDVEQRQRNFALGYTIWATVFGSIIEIRDLYYSREDIDVSTMSIITTNIGKNESDRILPFNMWVNLPITITPYFEIVFFLQFRILQYRLTTLYQAEEEKKDVNANISVTYRAEQSYEKLKNCVRQHQMLIDCCARLENVFTYMILAQVVIFSVLICFTGFQLLSETTTIARRCNFAFITIASTIMLFMFTYSCHGLVDQSDNVGIAAYSALWAYIPMNRAGKMIRNDLLMVIIRSRKYCCVTAYGFFPIALETFTKIMSTAVSYFTLLRQSSETANQS
ncbi:odorant receptor 13a-like [Colletes latitarsis]|uniref:odorant receptor 13a-like n=1 Tax=Colletes latitarsis TaxID=2605962 RepID=UPI0040361DA3